MFKKNEQECFIGFKTPSGFRPDKTRAASFLNGFKNIPGKACVNRVHSNNLLCFCELWKLAYEKSTVY